LRKLGGIQATTPINVVTATAAATMLTVTFDQSVILNGTPAFRLDVAAADPVGALQQGPNKVVITYSAPIDSATKLTLGYNDPAIRNASGGYVQSNTVSLP